MKPRIFVSSVIEGFKEFRQSAKRAIINSGGDPVLAEDFPSLSESPRNACLDGVVSCDIFLLILGDKGGFRAPSGKLVVQEEYEEAVRKKLKILVFIQNVDRDGGANELKSQVSDYVHGTFRNKFDSRSELEQLIEDATKPLATYYANKEIDMNKVNELLKKSEFLHNEAYLSFVIAPEREDEHIDPIDLESEEIKQRLLSLAHSEKSKLFRYEQGKQVDIGINDISITQGNEHHYNGDVNTIRLTMTTAGAFVIDMGLKPDKDSLQEQFIASMVILESDVIMQLKKCFEFVRAYYEMADPGRRYDRMYFNAALQQMQSKNLISSVPKGGGISIPHYSEDRFVAFENPRLIVRQDLIRYEKQIDAVLKMLKRQINTNRH